MASAAKRGVETLDRLANLRSGVGRVHFPKKTIQRITLTIIFGAGPFQLLHQPPHAREPRLQIVGIRCRDHPAGVWQNP